MFLEAINITDNDFKEKLNKAAGILLFYKELCPNCRALERMIDKFLSANPGIVYMRIDSEKCPEAMDAFETTRVPTVFILQDGKIVGKKIGLMNLREMTVFYESARIGTRLNPAM